jgi:opacity protein-like surface antigen
MSKTTGILAAWILAAGFATAARAQDGSLSLGGVTPSDEESFADQEGRNRRRTVTMDVWTGNIRVFLGGKGLDKADWEPVEIQNEFAILSDFGPSQWPVHMAVDLRFGASDTEDFLGLDVQSASWELNLGVRYVFYPEMPVRPYVGGGLAFGGAEIDLDGDTESDSGAGIWIDFGVDFSIGGPMTLGLELAWSSIPITVAGVDTDAGGFHLGLTIGFSF